MGMDCYMIVKANGLEINPPKAWPHEWIQRCYTDFAILTGGWECRNIYIDEDKVLAKDMVRLPGHRHEDEDSWGYRLTLADFKNYDWDTKVDDRREGTSDVISARESQVYRLYQHLKSLNTEDIVVEFTIGY